MFLKIILYKMSLTNIQVADNIINLLNRAIENDEFNNETEQFKLFNKIVKAGIKGQTKINIKSFKKEPSEYNIFVKDKMPEIKEKHPELSGSEIFKKIGSLWSEQKNNKDIDNKDFDNNDIHSKVINKDIDNKDLDNNDIHSKVIKKNKKNK